MSKIDEILATYGNYKTVNKQWVEDDSIEPFEIVGGNKILMDKAKQALLSAILAEMPKHDPYYQNKVENKSDEQLKIWHNRTVGYNQALEDVTKVINKLFNEGE